MSSEDNIKMAVIAGASEALKYRDKNPNASESEILQHVSDMSDKIVGNIEDDEL